jgi:hypothetical protein
VINQITTKTYFYCGITWILGFIGSENSDQPVPINIQTAAAVQVIKQIKKAGPKACP